MGEVLLRSPFSAATWSRKRFILKFLNDKIHFKTCGVHQYWWNHIMVCTSRDVLCAFFSWQIKISQRRTSLDRLQKETTVMSRLDDPGVIKQVPGYCEHLATRLVFLEGSRLPILRRIHTAATSFNLWCCWICLKSLWTPLGGWNRTYNLLDASWHRELLCHCQTVIASFRHQTTLTSLYQWKHLHTEPIGYQCKRALIITKWIGFTTRGVQLAPWTCWANEQRNVTQVCSQAHLQLWDPTANIRHRFAPVASPQDSDCCSTQCPKQVSKTRRRVQVSTSLWEENLPELTTRWQLNI